MWKFLKCQFANVYTLKSFCLYDGAVVCAVSDILASNFNAGVGFSLRKCLATKADMNSKVCKDSHIKQTIHKYMYSCNTWT